MIGGSLGLTARAANATANTALNTAASASDHWAFQPVSDSPVPLGTGSEGELGTAIDRFVVTALSARGLKLAPAVSRAVWIRRVTLDLTGLPPTWEEVDAFVRDAGLNARERVVDRLLASPRYGERWGRHWLDLARYADTHGGSAIGYTKFPFSYTYRDYVIRAFNDDVPYDRFVREQLAADQMALRENDPALAALGFLTVGMQYRNRHDVIDDQIDVVSRGLMGLTVACARCHDHKFDPITIRDYYGLYAALAGSTAPDLLPPIGPAPDPSASPDYQRELAQRQTRVDDMARDQSEVLRSRLRMQVGLYLRELAKGMPEQDTSTGFLSYRTDDLRPLVFNRWREYLAKMPETDPVFGPWVRLAAVAKAEADRDRTASGGAGVEPGTNSSFAVACSNLVVTLRKENGEAGAAKEQHKVSVDAPRWNPRVLEVLASRAPKTLVELADAYGALLGEVHQGWLTALSAASAEAAPDGQIIPDEDARHREINSAVLRQLRRHLYGADTPTQLPDAVASHLLNRPVNDNLAGRRGAIHDLHLDAPGSPARAMVLQEAAVPEDYHVMRRGNPLDRGARVEPRFLEVLARGGNERFVDGQRRMGLARAVVARENPLTRRVLVNWVWQQHFGQGLVRTPDDWGTRASRPVHLPLLDYLASRLVEDGWSLKRLHRRILLSAVYAQGSVEDARARTEDPDNELWWRMPRRRLDLESMRDSMLAVAGELDLTVGGRPVDLQAGSVRRRSVYGFVNRDMVSNFASTFDGANPSACTARRPETTVPQQTLFALNSEFIQDRALALARLGDGTADSAERVRGLYRRVYGRDPEPGETTLALNYVNGAAAGAGAGAAAGGVKDPVGAWARLAHALLAANEFVFVD